MKIRERTETRFSHGVRAGWLFAIASVLGMLARDPSIQDWLSEQAQAHGLGSLTTFESALVLGLPAIVIGSAAGILAVRHKRALQPLRDSELLLGGTHALFLRPFYTDVSLMLPNPFYSVWSKGMSLDGPLLQPEEFVGRVLEPFIDVRQFGGSPSTVGSARIWISDEEWQPAVMGAIQAASAIIVLPLLGWDRKKGTVRGGATVWELQYLVESGLMSRTIVLMPNEVWAISRTSQEAWERSRAHVYDFGLELPPYHERGGVFSFAQSGDAWQVERSFAPMNFSRKRLAAGLVEAIRWMSERYGFELLNR